MMHHSYETRWPARKRGRFPKFGDPETIGIIRSMYEAGKTAADIAAVVGASPESVQLIKTRNGIESKPSTYNEEIQEMLNKRWTTAEIAEHYGVGSSTIYKRISVHSLIRPGTKKARNSQAAPIN